MILLHKGGVCYVLNKVSINQQDVRCYKNKQGSKTDKTTHLCRIIEKYVQDEDKHKHAEGRDEIFWSFYSNVCYHKYHHEQSNSDNQTPVNSERKHAVILANLPEFA